MPAALLLKESFYKRIALLEISVCENKEYNVSEYSSICLHAAAVGESCRKAFPEERKGMVARDKAESKSVRSFL